MNITIEKEVNQIINKNILVEKNNNTLIIEEYKSYYNIYCKNILNDIFEEGILVY